MVTVCFTTLDGVPASVAQARRFVAAGLRMAPEVPVPDGVVATAELLTSELATNGLRHTRSGEAGQTFHVRTQVNGRGVLVQIRTRRPRRHEVPRVVVADPFAECGRGLFLVEALATTWGTLASPEDGVFFTLRWTAEQATAPYRAEPTGG